MIYFITENDSYVKIGYTESDPEGRLAGLQTGNPRKLQIYRVVEGDIGREKALHKQFDDLHINGEWFYLSKALRLYINSLVSCYWKTTPVSQEALDAADKLEKWREKQTEIFRATKDILCDALDRLIDERNNVK